MYYYIQIQTHVEKERDTNGFGYARNKIATLNSSRVVRNVRKRQCVASAFKQCTAINHSLTTEVANIRNETRIGSEKRNEMKSSVCAIKTKNEEKTKSSTL